MKIIVNKNSSITVFDQIYAEIENRIVTGILEPESKLPSIRYMCSEIGVSLMTMVKVYDELEKNGLIEKVHGNGSFVKSQLRNASPYQAEQIIDIEKCKNISDKMDSFKWQKDMEDYITVAGFRFNRNLSHSKTGINLSIASLGPHLLPTEKVLNHFYNDDLMMSHVNDSYPPIEGTEFMRNSVSGFLEQKNISAKKEEILITVGSQQALSLIAKTYVGPGDIVVVGAPTYPGAIDIFKSRGALILEVPITKDGMDPMGLLSICECHDVKLVYTMPNFQNPTGAVMSLENKKELLNLANEYNFLIVEDDVCSQLIYEGTALPLKALDTNGRVIYVCGFSKLYGHAFRLSAIVGSEWFITKFISAKSSSDGGAPLINQMILASYINSIEQKHYLADLTEELKGLRDRVYLTLKKNLPDYVKVEKPKGGMLFWLTFPRDYNCNLLQYKSIEKYQITFLPGEFCYSGKLGKNQMRLCFTAVEEEVIHDAIIKLCSIMDEVADTI